jgi:(p)ppGpp synthase/HD superfamily hydrolase
MHWDEPGEKLFESMTDVAMDIAHQAHLGQVRRGDRSPYITHPVRVRSITQRFGYPRIVQLAAILHDAIEDADNPDDVERWIKAKLPKVLPIVKAVTHDRGTAYFDYIKDMRGYVLQVKLSDMLHNLLDYPGERQRKKYRAALTAISNAHDGKPSEIHPDHWHELISQVGLEPVIEQDLREYVRRIVQALDDA